MRTSTPGQRVKTPLRFLIVALALAFFTPLLPLAAPARPDLAHKLEPPRFDRVLRRGFEARWMVAPDALTRQLVSLRLAVFGDRYLGPILGTDELGRCLLSRLCHGSRVSLFVGLLATLVSLVVGVSYGAIAGFAGGRWDGMMMRALDVLYSLPLMFVVIFVVSGIRGLRQEDPELGLDPTLVLFAVIGAISWLVMARLVRGEVLSLRGALFVQAARAQGASSFWILRRHLLPNAGPLIIVAATLTVPRILLLEAWLSFLGLGVEAPQVSWGLIAREGFDAMSAVHLSWWLLLFPSLAIGSCLFTLNTLGDRLRDALDPKLRRSAGPKKEAR